MSPNVARSTCNNCGADDLPRGKLGFCSRCWTYARVLETLPEWDPADPATWQDEAARLLARHWPKQYCTAKQFVRFCRQASQDGLMLRALHEEQYRGEARIRQADIADALGMLRDAIYFRPQRLTTPAGLMQNLKTEHEKRLVLTFLRDYLETTRHCEPSVGQLAAALAEAAYRKRQPQKKHRQTLGLSGRPR